MKFMVNVSVHIHVDCSPKQFAQSHLIRDKKEFDYKNYASSTKFLQ